MNQEDRSSHIKKIKKDISNLKSIGVDGVFLNKKNKNTLSDLISNKDKKSHFLEGCQIETIYRENNKSRDIHRI